ncbi:MAG: transposase, partial [Planctomycetes bacterium]|nr:transposase [Planctomycetota bacterium]
YLLSEGNLEELAASYPTPRTKEEVPLWLFVASQISLRLHGEQAYSSYPLVMHCGGLRDALGPEQVTVAEQSGEDGERRLRCEGYNAKNTYERRTPCDQDYLRKLARDTRPESLEAWFNGPVVRYLRGLKAFDEEGIFLLDGSYLFVPDNPAYEGSSRLRFGEHGHPLSKDDYEALTDRQKEETEWRRCYRAVFLLHADRHVDTHVFAGLALRPGRAAEVPEVRPLVEKFVGAAGKGVLKLLIHDRGFIDGKTMSWMKAVHGIDTLFPLKAGMSDLEDARVLAEQDGQPWQTWHPPEPVRKEPPPQRPENLRRREEKRQRTLEKKRREAEAAGEPKPVALTRVELKRIPSMRLWGTAHVPVCVILMREYYSDGSMGEWALATTRESMGAIEARELYHERTRIEERHRQLKCFWDLSRFRSRALSLVTSQVVFVLLAYSLIQDFLRRIEREEMNPKTRDRILRELRYQDDRLLLYSRGRFTYLTPLEHQELLLTLSEAIRRRVLARTRKLRERQLAVRLPIRPGV